MPDWKLINAARHRDKGPYGTTDKDGFTGMFFFRLNGLPVRVLASDEGGWKHVSVSILGKPNVVPSWSIMCQIKEIFWGAEDWVVQFHPARSEYVNHHEGCLHLWQPTEVLLPTPPTWMVGPKDGQSVAEGIAEAQRALKK